MTHLRRADAPISAAAWAEIDAEATRTLEHYLSARKLVDFVGPLGWEASSLPLGRAVDLATPPVEGVAAAQRTVRPLVELRRELTLARREIDAIDRGARDADLGPVVAAARDLALAEDLAALEGYAAAGIVGIGAASPHDPVELSEDFDRYPNHVAAALAVLKAEGVGGPYAIALGPRCYKGVIETTERGGYPLLQHLHLILGGPVIWAPAVDGAIVLSQRGGDFELTVGQDISIGYASHDGESVRLYLEESLTFSALSPEAAVPLRYPS